MPHKWRSLAKAAVCSVRSSVFFEASSFGSTTTLAHMTSKLLVRALNRCLFMLSLEMSKPKLAEYTNAW